MFGRLKRATARTNPFVPGSAVFPSVDVDRLADDLDLAKLGAERGRENRPPQDHDMLDPVESRAVEKVGELRRRGLNNYEDHLKVFAQRLNRASDSRSQIETQIGNVKTDMDATIKIWDGHLATDRSDVTMRSREYREFVNDNRLRSRTARELSYQPLFWLTLIALVLVESVLNGIFFARSNEQGWFGGIGIALGIAVLNIGVATLAGPVVRNINHVSLFRTALGVLVLGSWTVATFVLNLGVAHFRDVADGRAWDTAATLSLRNAVQQPTDLQSIESWLLLVFGCFFALFALMKSYRSDDPYPGFGIVSRRWVAARDSYAARVEEALKEVVQKRDDAKDRLEEASAEVRQGIGEAVDIFQARSGLMSQRDEFLAHCEDAANRLLSIYREENRAHRTEPPPPHFAAKHSFEPFKDRHAVNDANVTEAAKESERIRESVERAVKAIFAECGRAIESYKSMDDLEDPAETPPWRSRTKDTPVGPEGSGDDGTGGRASSDGKPAVRVVGGAGG